MRQAQLERGYLPVITPHIGKLDLYITSGHYPYYKESQYTPINVDEEQFMLKPMNCPHHIEIYKSEQHSYRDLPLRLAEFGTVYRYEQSGELNGLTRVRGFTVDDSHLFVTPEQLEEEFIGVVDLIQHVFNTMGFEDFRARLGTNDAKQRQICWHAGDVAAGHCGDSASGRQSRHALHGGGRRSGLLRAKAGLYLPGCAEAGVAAWHGAGGLFCCRSGLI